MMSAATSTAPRPRGPVPGRPPAPPPPLLDLLGATWAMDAPVSGVAWDGDLAGFALGDGSLAMARAEWPGAPAVRRRAEGGSELTPGTAPPPPMSRLRVHGGACLALARDPAGGFLSGGDDGVLAHAAEDGTVTVLQSFPGRWVDLVAAAGGMRACAVGRVVHVSGAATATVELPASATALAWDPAGRFLAAAHYRGATIWSDGEPTRLLSTPGCPRSIAWSPDGRYVVCGLQENALHGWRLSDGGDIEMGGYPGQPRSLSFAADGSFLASSGAPRAVCWRFDPPDAGLQPAECGMPSSRTPVCRVACHPAYPLIAVGYHNGAVLLCQPGSEDVLFTRGSSAGAPGSEPGAVPPGSSITALAWSADGGRIAMATEAGAIGLLTLPADLFRFATRSSQPAQGSATP